MIVFNKGDKLAPHEIPHELRHLFDNPEHYHWNYPRGNEHEITKNVRIVINGNYIIIEFN